MRRRRRRLARILLNAATGVSLLLCVATAVLWVRSRWHVLAVDHSVSRRVGPSVVDSSYRMFGGPDSVAFVRDIWTHAGVEAADLPNFLRHPEWSVDSWSVGQLAPDPADPTFFHNWTDWRVHSVVGIYDGGRGRGELKTLELPYAVLFMGTAALPVLAARRAWRRHRTARKGHCQSCGYDLRATPDRCPECGAVPATLPTT
jgi:hypothetical protein